LFNMVLLFASPTLRQLHSVRRDTFIPRTKYLGSIILLTAWTDNLFRAVQSFPFFPYWSNHYFPHHSSTLLLLALCEYFPCQQITALLACIRLLAGHFLSSCVGLPTATSLYFLLHNRQFNAVVQILSSASCARPRPARRKSRERPNLCVGNTVDVLAATFPVHRSSALRLPPA
jgi:hypothetical protein